ncbi:MAG TPA: glycosyltransferase family 4 protein, partial [Polyangiaceae bacterium]|nr:glycosyltransferase family 4 protein [Polyangiaceae bacterium]
IWDHSATRRRFDARLSELPAALQERIRVVGPVGEPTLTALQRRADVFLYPSLHEGWGLAALESLAAGTAVITSNREPFTEFLDADTARLVDPESVGAIANALIALLGDPAARRALGRAGVERARQFDWRHTAACHLAAYRPLAATFRAADLAAPRTWS